MSMSSVMADVDMKLEILDYQIEHIVSDFMKALDKFEPERHWSYTMDSVRRISTSGVFCLHLRREGLRAHLQPRAR